MKIFLDTNVLVDYLNKREPFFADAALVIDICERNDIIGVVSSLSVINTAYINVSSKLNYVSSKLN